MIRNFLLNRKSIHPYDKEQLTKLKRAITADEYRLATDKACAAVKYLQKNLIHYEIEYVDRTDQGVTGESQKVNPSDLVIVFRNDKRLGLSLKSQAVNNNPTLSNPGIGTIESYTNLFVARDYLDQGYVELWDKHPEIEGVKGETLLVPLFKQNDKLNETSLDIGKRVLGNIAKDQLPAIDNLPYGTKRSFLAEMMKTSPTKFPVFYVNTMSNLKTRHLQLENAFDHILDDVKKISIIYNGGTTGTFVHENVGKFAQLRLKFSNRFGSSIKGNFTLLKEKK